MLLGAAVSVQESPTRAPTGDDAPSEADVAAQNAEFLPRTRTAKPRGL
jgi:hypothetical protein